MKGDITTETVVKAVASTPIAEVLSNAPVTEPSITPVINLDPVIAPVIKKPKKRK